MMNLLSAIAPLGFMRLFRRQGEKSVFRSMHRTVCTVKPVISRIPARILYGLHPRAAADLITQTCRYRSISYT